MPLAGTQISIGWSLALCRHVGFQTGLIRAVAIMTAESGRYTGAWHENPDGSIDRGLFQINNLHESLTDEDAYLPIPNAAFAYQLSQGGTDFTPWAVWNHKTYLRYMPEVAFVKMFGRGWRKRVDRVPLQTWAQPSPE